MRFGIETFGDVQLGADNKSLSQAETLRLVVEQAVFADQLGIDSFGVGEHHRDDFAVTATDTVLAAIASRTETIELHSAVTVLSSEDPIRVFQRFSTLNALSNGRAGVIVGRGSFTESFALFGYQFGDYEVLFEEKLAIFAQLARTGEVTWAGTTRPPLTEQKVYPPIENGGELRVAIGVGGSPQSVIRAAKYNFPLMLAIIGGDPVRFGPFADLYRQALAQHGFGPQPIGIHSLGYIAETDAEAREQMWPGYAKSFGRIGRERGWGPMSRDHYDEEVNAGSLYVGSPDTVAPRIARAMAALGAERFDLKFVTGPMRQEHILRSIELYATEVIPRVKKLLTA